MTKTTMRGAALGTLLALALLTTGCGGGGTEAKSYDGPTAVRDALSAKDIKCDDFSEQAIGEGAKGASCKIGGQQTAIISPLSEKDRKELTDGGLKKLNDAGGTKMTVVLGPNWAVLGSDKPTIEKVRSAIGGDLLE
jgi:hypothetical protein